MVALLSFNASADVLKYRFTGQLTDMAEYNNGTGTFTELRWSDLAGKPVTVEELVIGYFSYDTVGLVGAARRERLQWLLP